MASRTEGVHLSNKAIALEYSCDMDGERMIKPLGTAANHEIELKVSSFGNLDIAGVAEQKKLHFDHLEEVVCSAQIQALSLVGVGGLRIRLTQ